MDYIRKVDPLNLQTSNLAESWRIFWQNYQIFTTAAEVDKKPDNVKIAIFLNAIGPEAVEVYNSFNLTEEDKQKYDAVTKAFENFCKPKKNEVYESYIFHSRKQETDEPFDNFLMNIKKLVRSCDFGDQESRMLRDRIVLGTRDKALQKKLLEMDNLNLDKAIEMARTAEIAKQQMEKLQPDTSTVNLVNRVPNKINLSKNNNRDFKYYCRQKTNIKQVRDSSKSEAFQKKISNNVADKIISCTYCMQKHESRKCPAYGSTCRSCGKKNHYAIACRSKSHKVHELRNLKVNSDDDFFINTLEESALTITNKTWVEHVKIANQLVKFKLDTGADLNVLPLNTFKSLGNKKLEKVGTKIHAYGGTALETVGKAKFNCKVRNQIRNIEFFVIKNGTTPILGLNTCVELNLIKRINTLSQNVDQTKFLKENADLFEGLGTFVKNFHINLKETAVPVAKTARRIPLSIRDAVKIELDRLENTGIIEKTDGPSDWISNIVIVEKPGKKIRICLDPKAVNEALRPINHPIPSFQELTAKLSNKSFFTVLDLKDGYFQIELDKFSSDICTFSTPFGLYKYKRLPFGVRIAPEIFQKYNESNFADIEGVSIYIDDILIAAENETQHDEILKKVIDRARQLNIKFNKEKIQYKVRKVKFLGHIISQEGISCDPDRIKAIQNLLPPQNKKELQQLLGMINYVRSFIPHLSQISAPIRDLLKKDAHFKWEDVHSSCLEKIKTLISEAPILNTFSINKDITIQADASKFGLGACMMQEGKPIYYASRSLTETEIRYSQVEKEMLAIVFACEKFHYFLYGRTFKVITDHKPLLGVFNKEITKIPNARLQRMLLRLSKYNMSVSFSPGKYMYIADLLSRKFLPDVPIPEIPDLDKMVHSINVSEARKQKFIEETNRDDTLILLKNVLINGWPKDKSKLHEKIKFFWKLRNDLYLQDNIIFLNDRIIVPQSMRQEILEILHKPHQGIEKTKNRARSLVYWPGINEAIENTITKCQICQKHRNNNARELYLPHEVPDIPFDKICMDICEMGKQIYLIVNDYFSKYLEIIPLRTKTSAEIIAKLKGLFATHGLPKTIIADNNPFGSYMFRKFCEAYDIKIITSSPHYPQSNGLAERSVQTAKKLIQKTKESKGELWMSLLEFRNTPIKGSMKSPAEILMGRKQRTMLPIKTDMLKKDTFRHIHNQIEVSKKRYEKYYNRSAKEGKNFQKGESIWVKCGKIWQKGIVAEKHPTPRSYWVRLADGSTLRRNSSFLRSRYN